MSEMKIDADTINQLARIASALEKVIPILIANQLSLASIATSQAVLSQKK